MATENLLQKWAPILNHPDIPAIRDIARRNATAQLLENTQSEISQAHQVLSEAGGIPVNTTGAGIANFDPILISLVRRAAPALIAYDIAGVQPMTGPTGIVFALRSRYGTQSGTEALYNEANTAFSSVVSGNTTIDQNQTGTVPTGNTSTYNTAGGMPTAQAEALGASGNTAWAQMAFSIEKVTVTAQSRKLASSYTLETAQDLKKVHGLDADAELSSILASEILAEINRELLRTINITAVAGSQSQVTTAGTYDLDTDSNGRWMVEKFKGLMFQLDREANQIAKDTRRGKGNFVICSSDVASAFAAAGLLSYTPNLDPNSNLQVTDVGNTFAGVLNGRYKVYIDPFTTGNYFTIGYKGADSYDVGLIYAPYVPLQKLQAVDPATLTPVIGYQTRYGLVANPFAEGTNQGLGRLAAQTNKYYRFTQVANLV
jgi:hypothetical protein